ncbi:MAG: hypothetical protein WCV90_01380 [Candidatus Woesearchaeota archaeon]|jgi:hypothetical protein
MTNHKTLILAGLTALGIAACGSTPQTYRPTSSFQEREITPCESASPNDSSYAFGFRVVGDDQQKLFYSKAVGIKTGMIKVTAFSDDQGTSYRAEGTTPNDKVHSDSLSNRYYRDMAVGFLEEADLIDGKKDKCVLPKSIDTLMDRLYRENATYDFVGEPSTISIDSESYYLSTQDGTGHYQRTETTENGETQVREDLSGNLSKEEIVGGEGVSGKCGWNYNRDIGDCDWSMRREKGDCDWDFRTDGKSQRWLTNCLSDADYHYNACAGLAESKLSGCRER